jgi:hypothetical protein
MKPDAEEEITEFEIASGKVYLVLAIVCYVVLGFSYYKPKYMAFLTWISTVYISLRLAVRTVDKYIISDQEERELIDEKESSSSWTIFVTFSYQWSIYGIIFLFTSFEGTILRNTISYTTNFISGFCILIGLNGVLGLQQFAN